MFSLLRVVLPLISNRTGTLKKFAGDVSRRSARKAVGLLASTAALLITGSSAQGSGEVELPDSFFPIGVWSQPNYSFDKWKGRGINFLMRWESLSNTVTAEKWSADARARGLYYIRQPSPTITNDRNDSNLLAWMHEDEPDYRNRDPQLLVNDYNLWKSVDPQKPVLVNFSGGNVNSGATTQAKYIQYLASTDWVSNDMYPVSGWGRPDWIDYSIPATAPRRTPGRAMDKLREWSGGKEQFAIIEPTNYKLPQILNSRGVTPDEFRGELWHSIIRGAKGVVYFPQQIGGGFKFDAVPQNVVDEMAAQHPRIQSLARVLNSTPDRRGDVLPLSSGLLEGMARNFEGDEYFFILNMSTTTQDNLLVNLPDNLEISQLSVIGENRNVSYSDGLVYDDFRPYEMHVYHADISGLASDPASKIIPEPSSLTMVFGGLFLLRRKSRTAAN